jgi:hypothetical protein
VAIVLAVAVAIAVAAGIAFIPSLVSALSEDDREFSLCPEDRGSTQIVSDSQMAEDAADYQGPAPHLVFPEAAIPENWEPPRESDGRYQLDKVQLVVCSYQYAVGEKENLRTCLYQPIGGGPYSRVVLQSAKVDYRLYEAATGKLLTSFTLEAVAEDCAKYRKVLKDTDHDTTEAASPDPAEVKRRIEPFVLADLR